MIEAEKASARWVAVGYQWSFSPAVQALKEDILSGLFGAGEAVQVPLSLAAGRSLLRTERLGGQKARRGRRRVLDSRSRTPWPTTSTTCSTSSARTRSRAPDPAEVQAELYRAYPIENFDTAAVARPDRGGRRDPLLREPRLGERPGPGGRATTSRRRSSAATAGPRAVARFPDGTRKDYGIPDAEPMDKLWPSIAGVREEGTRPLCGLEAAAGQTLRMNGIQDSMPEIRDFPAAMIRVVEGAGARRLAVETPGAKRRVVEGLDEAFAACYEAGKLPSEMGLAWSARGEVMDLGGYAAFPSRGEAAGA